MIDKNTLIPTKDSTFVPFGAYEDVEIILKSKMFYPVYVTGPSGTGKNTMIEQICANNSLPIIRINVNSMTDEDQLVGTKTLVDGNISVVEGPLILGMRYGIPVLIDEIDLANSNLIMSIQSIIEGKPYFFKLKNEIIIPQSGFNILATANTKGKGSIDGRYIGTNILNEAFLERFAVTFDQGFPSMAIEKRIVSNLMKQCECYDELVLSSLVKWTSVVRKTFEDGGVDEVISTRRLAHIVRAFAIYKDIVKAIELCTNRFDAVTSIAFKSLFDKIHVGKEDA